ncbi:MAG: glycosyl hydrolase family 28-related protein [Terriglobia bacterium]
MTVVRVIGALLLSAVEIWSQAIAVKPVPAPGNRSVLDMGADSTGEGDSLAAFNAAKTAAKASGRIYVPAGTYNLSGQFTMQGNNLHLACELGAEIRYTGTQPVDSVIAMGEYTGSYGPKFSFNQSIENCTIRGNSQVKKAVLHLSNAPSARVSNVNLKDGPTCLLSDYGNTQLLDHVLCTQYNGVMTIVPTIGIWLDHMNNVSIRTPSVEDLASTPEGNRCSASSKLPAASGIKLTHAGPVTIDGGTSEGNSTGVEVSDSTSVFILNMDNETNCIADVEASGAQIHVSGGLQMNLVHLRAPCHQCTVDRAETGQITVDSGVTGAQITNNAYANTSTHGNTISDFGTDTTILNNRSANGGGFFPEKFGGVQISGDEKSWGFGTPPAVPADDPSGYLPAFQTYSSFIKLGLGPRTSPACDASHGHGDIWYDRGAPGVSGSFDVCVKDRTDAWTWRTLYADSGNATVRAPSGSGCTLTSTTAPACANAGCMSTIPVVTSVAMACPAAAGAPGTGAARP